MTKHFQNFVLKLLIFAGLLIAVHYYIFFNFFSEVELYFPLWSIYAFNAILVFVVYSFISHKVSQGSDKTLSIFLTLTLLKMVLAIIFLLPLFAGKVVYMKTEVFNFFIPYFLFLGFEIYLLNDFFKNQQTK